MQLRLALSVPKFTGSLFKQSTSAILTGVTIAGAFATVIFQSSLARSEVNKAFSTFASLLQNSSFGSGINKLGETFKQWGTTIVSKKYEFKQWVKDYLNPEGFKSGSVALYEKLYDWALIVYDWFRNKFIKFIENIPWIVQNWRTIRLSLFKWGTFLGGGGGSALFAMFGNGDNWGKLSELMGNEDFAEAIQKFGELVEQNPETFGKMPEEDMQEILQKLMDDPQGAKEAAEELLEEQKKENEGQEGEPKELQEERIKEAYSEQSGGRPKTPEQALGGFMSSGLKAIMSADSSQNITELSRNAMRSHLDKLRKSSTGNTEVAKTKRDFLEAIKDSEDELIKSFSGLMVRAHSMYSKVKETLKKENPKILEELFENEFKDAYTRTASGDEEANAIGIEDLVNLEVQTKSRK